MLVVYGREITNKEMFTMKRNLTLILKEIHEDWRAVTPKNLSKRIDKKVKVLGEIKVGGSLELYFEDGFVFKTAALDLNGFINKYDKNNNLVNIIICTKDLSFVFNISEETFDLKVDEQLKLKI